MGLTVFLLLKPVRAAARERSMGNRQPFLKEETPDYAAEKILGFTYSRRFGRLSEFIF